MPEGSVIPEAKSTAPETSPANTLVWAGKGVRVISPEKPIVPREEGLYFMIGSDTGEGTWKDRDVKEVLRQTFFALPIARVVAEANSNPDFWVNIQLKSIPGFDSGVNVIGRNPRSETSWAKPPVKAHVSGVKELGQEDRIRELIQRYIPKRDETQITLFPNGINEVKVDSDEFRQFSEKHGADVLWMNNKYAIDVVKKSHLSGLHLERPEAKEEGAIKRPWQVAEDTSEVPTQRQDFEEMMASALVAQRVIKQKELPYHNVELQANGNWTPSMQPKERGGGLDTNSVDKVSEKRSHRQFGERDWIAGTHIHLYATGNRDEYVGLPLRSEAEVPEEWEGIVPAPTEEVVNLGVTFQAEMTSYLVQNAVGKL